MADMTIASRAETARPLLDELLAEGVAGAIERERTEFDRFTAPFTDALVLFGAGNMGRLIRRKLRTVGVEPLAFADNNPALRGGLVEGVPVLSPAEAANRFGSSAAFVIAIWGVGAKDRMASRVRQLRDLGCRKVVPFPALFWKHPGLFLPYHMVDRPHKVHQDAGVVREVYDFWADDFSRREYLAQLQWRLRGDFDCMADPVEQTVYFPSGLFGLGEREVFVDCGAYDGDTVESFLKVTGRRFQWIVAFEPDPANHEKLRRSVAALPSELARRIETHQKAVGASDGLVRFAALGTDGSGIGEGDLEVECVTLDRALQDRPAPSHIKMDIEGAEIEALQGARATVARHRPVLAICSYHRQSDLWNIPSLIHSLNPDYRLFLRPHLMDGWDVVCYAVPPGRTAV
ncbi:MAG TPA: FkbM family methyltransferase [Bryobacteraceae bacterium]|nr:FkbM family methyltransferase [Bryobacteraceae bacterium]